MKKILLITVLLLTLNLVWGTELIIHKTNGSVIAIDMADIVNIDFSGEQASLLQLVPVPQHLDWVEPGAQSKIAHLSLLLKDGNDQPMAEQEIVISGYLGEPENGEYIYQTDANGEVELDWEFQKYECPPPSPNGPGTTTASIEAQVIGFPISKISHVVLFRYVD